MQVLSDAHLRLSRSVALAQVAWQPGEAHAAALDAMRLTFEVYFILMRHLQQVLPNSRLHCDILSLLVHIRDRDTAIQPIRMITNCRSEMIHQHVACWAVSDTYSPASEEAAVGHAADVW